MTTRQVTIELTCICDSCSKFQRTEGTTFIPATIPHGWMHITIFNPNSGKEKEGHICVDCQEIKLNQIIENLR